MMAQWVFDEDEPLRLPDPCRYERHPDILPLGLEFLDVLALLDGLLNVTDDRVIARIYDNGVIRVTIRHEFPRLIGGNVYDRVEMTAWGLQQWDAVETSTANVPCHFFGQVFCCIDLAWWIVQKVTGLKAGAFAAFISQHPELLS